MIPIVSFIGWKNSGKTTIAQEVVNILKEKGLRVAVIKSTHHSSIEIDNKNTDTNSYRKANADSVTLLGPDQMVTVSNTPEMKLTDIVHRLFYDVDIVIGEGFKNERHIAKIEVARDDGNFLKDEVNGVVAVISDNTLPDIPVFEKDQYENIADFIMQNFIENTREHQMDAVLFVNGKKVPMKGFVKDALAGTVHGFIKSLKKTENPKSIEIRVHLN